MDRSGKAILVGHARPAGQRTAQLGRPCEQPICHSQMYETEAWGRPRDAKRLPPPRGNGLWTQEIYYHILNSGLRIPPSAGSASGVLPNPVGYNRVYVHTGEHVSWDAWWNGLRKGRSFWLRRMLFTVLKMLGWTDESPESRRRPVMERQKPNLLP